jgi:superfamily II DNA or RNA helicase
MVDAGAIIRLVGPTFFQRGRDYARSGAVTSLEWEPVDGVLSGTVQGSAPHPYRCVVTIPSGGRATRAISGTCTCPVGFDCKHVAALLLASNESAARELAPVRRTAEPRASWKRTLEAAVGAAVGEDAAGRPASDGPPPSGLGLLFELRAQRAARHWDAPRRGHFGGSTGPTGSADHRPDPIAGPSDSASDTASGTASATPRAQASQRLGVRPVIRSASGNWVRTGVSWGTLAYLGNRVRVDPAQFTWFRQFSALSRSTSLVYYGQDSEWIMLDDFPSPLLWRLLDDAAAHGIPLVTGKTETDVTVTSAAVGLEVSSAGDGLKLTTTLEVDGRQRPLGAASAIGDHGLYLSETAAGARRRFWLAPLPSQQLALIGQPAVSLIPGREVDEFFSEYYPRLRRTLPIASTDPELVLPDIVPPTLVVTVVFEPTQTVRWSLSWEGMRDEHAERVIRERVASLLPDSAALHGLAAADFATGVLPQLQTLEGVRVELVGERPDYRELTEPPRLVVSTVDTSDRDWFDLGVNVTVEGHTIPFVDLFTALSRGRTRLLLVDHSYLSLEQPVFDELRRLIAEASELGEWQTGLRISRFQASLWSEFEDLADETEQAQAWRATASGLLGEVDPVPPPPGLVATLRPYQQQGLDWLAFLWKNGLGGILADDMGLGKTLQTLALVAYATASGPQDSAAAAPRPGPFLVVAPTSVVGNWVAEAARFTPGLVVRGVTATQATSGVPLSALAAGVDVVVTSYALFRLDFADYQALRWSGLILDEAQFVKNAASKAHQCAVELDAPFKLAITGTPLENSLTDLWALLRIVAPGLFASARRFREDYVRPLGAAAGAAGVGDQSALLARLRRRIRPLMLRRTKELVATELPPKQEQLLRVELSPKHRKLYELTLQRERQKLLGLIDDLDRNRFIVFRSLTLLRMLSLDAALIDEQNAGIPSAKLEALLEQLRDVVALGHRALVFSQFTSFLARAASMLDEAGISHEYLDGSTRRRAEVIDRFREGEAPVFLISLKAGGFGLNLTEADYVFLLDPWWNPATETQAIDRTHRIGQTRSVNVYRLIASGTIEEKVMALRDGKAQLFDAVLDEGEAFGATLTADDIRGLLDG